MNVIFKQIITGFVCAVIFGAIGFFAGCYYTNSQRDAEDEALRNGYAHNLESAIAQRDEFSELLGTVSTDVGRIRLEMGRSLSVAGDLRTQLEVIYDANRYAYAELERIELAVASFSRENAGE